MGVGSVGQAVGLVVGRRVEVELRNAAEGGKAKDKRRTVCSPGCGAAGPAVSGSSCVWRFTRPDDGERIGKGSDL